MGAFCLAAGILAGMFSTFAYQAQGWLFWVFAIAALACVGAFVKCWEIQADEHREQIRLRGGE